MQLLDASPVWGPLGNPCSDPVSKPNRTYILQESFNMWRTDYYPLARIRLDLFSSGGPALPSPTPHPLPLPWQCLVAANGMVSSYQVCPLLAQALSRVCRKHPALLDFSFLISAGLMGIAEKRACLIPLQSQCLGQTFKGCTQK